MAFTSFCLIGLHWQFCLQQIIMPTDFVRGVIKALEAPRKSLYFNSGHKPVLSISSLEEAFLFPHISQTIATSPYLLPLSSINILVLPSFNMEATIYSCNTFLAKLFLNIINREGCCNTNTDVDKNKLVSSCIIVLLSLAEAPATFLNV